MRRVVVIGTSGCGKSTLARAIAAHLKVPYVEIDALYWDENWTPRPRERVLATLDQFTQGDGWAVDGNYQFTRSLVWPRADTIVWLDYSMSTNARRVVWRTVRRWWRKEELWSGNRESMRTQLFSRESLFLWVLTSWRRHRRDYPKMLRQPGYAHLRVHRFRTPAQAEDWLDRFRQS